MVPCWTVNVLDLGNQVELILVLILTFGFGSFISMTTLH